MQNAKCKNQNAKSKMQKEKGKKFFSRALGGSFHFLILL